MKSITVLYIINATLLLLHEIESAYEKEWELLKLPGGITGFLLIHIPIIIFILYGLILIDKLTAAGMVFGVILGIGGVIPFIVHKLAIKSPGQFSLPISSGIIYLNVISGLWLLALSVRGLVR